MPTTPYFWTQALDGRWEFISRWSPTGVPDSRVEDAFITATGAPYKVALENYIVNVVNGGSTEVRAMELHDLEVGSQATLNVGMDGFYLEKNLKADGLVNVIGTSKLFIGTATGASSATWSGTGNIFLLNGGNIWGMLGADPTLNLDTRLWITRDNNSQFTAGMQSMSLNITQGSLTVTNGASLDLGGKDLKNAGSVSASGPGSHANLSVSGIMENKGLIYAANAGSLTINTLGNIGSYNTGTISALLPNSASSFATAVDIYGNIDQRSNTGHGNSSGVIESIGFKSAVSINTGAVFGGTLRTADNGRMDLYAVTLNGADQAVTIDGKIGIASSGGVVGTIKGLATGVERGLIDIAEQSTLTSQGVVLEYIQVVLDQSTINGTGTVTLTNSWINGSGTILAPLMINQGSEVEAFSFLTPAALTLNSGSNVQNNGKLIASNSGQLVVADKVVGSGSITLNDGGDIKFLKEVSQNISIVSSGNTKEDIAFSFAYSGAIQGLGKGDTIDLLYAAANTGRTATYTGNAFNGTLKISNPDGSLFTNILLTGDYRNTGFSLSADGLGGTLITLTDKLGPTDGPDNLVGTSGPDLIDALGGNDTITGGGGNDTINGGVGSDTAVFTAASTAVTVTAFNGTTAVLNAVGNETDRLINVETLQFADKTIANSSVSQFRGLDYIASFNDLIPAFGLNAQAAFDHYITNGFFEGRVQDNFRGFDYIASYDDLIRNLPANEDEAVRHFISNGFTEGRSRDTFDARFYLGSYADLRAAFGTNQDAAAAHFVTAGFFEGRSRNDFNPLEYIASYDDLIRAFGANSAAGLSHFENNGFNEGRGDSFDGLQYIASYGDLIRAFGTNRTAGTTHFITNGLTEGRSRDNFNAAQYLANYADLRAAFGSDENAATLHYIGSGYFEGRTDHFI